MDRASDGFSLLGLLAENRHTSVNPQLGSIEIWNLNPRRGDAHRWRIPVGNVLSGEDIQRMLLSAVPRTRLRDRLRALLSPGAALGRCHLRNCAEIVLHWPQRVVPLRLRLVPGQRKVFHFLS